MGSFHDELVRDLRHRTRWRRRFCRVVTIGRHAFGSVQEVHCGPVDFIESEETLIGRMQQCRLCYHCEVVRG